MYVARREGGGERLEKKREGGRKGARSWSNEGKGREPESSLNLYMFLPACANLPHPPPNTPSHAQHQT